MASIQSSEDYSKDTLSSSADDYEEGDEEEPLLKGQRDHEREGSLLPSDLAGKRHNRRRWLSIYIMYFTMFLSAVTFSIVLSSMWPYLLQVDYSGATATFLGWVVASYSFGQLIASPVLGLWADYRPTREPLIVSLIFNIVFNVLYAYVGVFPPNLTGWVMLIARGFVGFGAGIAAVVRSYVSESTLERERTGAMAGVSASQALGFIIGPALGLAFVPLGSIGLKIPAIKFALNMYTGPGYLGALLGVMNIFLLVFLFKEYRLYPQHHKGGQCLKKNKKKKEADRDEWDQLAQSMVKEEEAGKVDSQKLTNVDQDPSASTSINNAQPASLKKPQSRQHYDLLAAIVCIILFFGVLFVFSVFETIATPLSMDEFAWSKQQGVLYNNAFFAGLAVIAVATFLIIKFMSKRVDERVTFMVGLFFIAFGFFTLIPMSDFFPKLAISTTLGSMPLNSSGKVPEHFSAFNLTNETDFETVGCREIWCPNVPALYLFQYALALVMIAIGYPAASVLCYSIYSKILGPFPQGIMMGWLTAAGSLARCLGPLSISALYHQSGPEMTFSVMDGVVFVLIIILLVFSCKLVPYNSRRTVKFKFINNN